MSEVVQRCAQHAPRRFPMILLWSVPAALRVDHRPAATRRARCHVGGSRRSVRLEPAPRQLLDGLAEALALLADDGCTRVWINGSFVTAKDEPGDFDVVWDPTDVDLDRLDAIFFDFADGRRAQKERFGGELLPNVVERRSGLVFAEFFQNERDTGFKGIVVIDPRRIEQ